MSEEPINPYYFYDNASDEDLEEKLKKKTFEFHSYAKWMLRAEEEINYIKKVQGSRVI